MPVETASTFAGLNQTFPAEDHSVSEAASHLRLIKTLLKTLLPGITAPVTASAADLNNAANTRTRVLAVEANRLRSDVPQTATGPFTVSGTVNATTVAQGGNPLIPRGTIVMWWGSVASVPAGWTLCNGSNGAPDLRDKFVIGAGGSMTPVTGAGSNYLNISTGAGGDHAHGGAVAQAGGHAHSGTTLSAGSHAHGGSTAAHTLTLDEIPAHNHGAPIGNAANSGTSGVLTKTEFVDGTAYTQNAGNGFAHAHGIGTDGDHAHGFFTTEVGPHQHAISQSGTHTHPVSFDNRPACVALCYIMKT